MLILKATVEGASDLQDLCYGAADLSNRLEVGIDVEFAGQVIQARPRLHPYNLVQAFEQAVAAQER